MTPPNKPTIPDERWQPLSVEEGVAIFNDAPFTWYIAGGYAVELFLGESFREHEDLDIVVFRDEQLDMQHWMLARDWVLYCADPPGTLRFWNQGEYLAKGVHDIWGHEAPNDFWQLQLMIAEVEGDEWFSRHNPQIRGKRTDIITTYSDLPCIRIEVQLLYKSRGLRPKDRLDFDACLPYLSAEAKDWLIENLQHLHPQGHEWLTALGG